MITETDYEATLNREQERNLIREAQEGNSRAVNILVSKNMGYVSKVARREAPKYGVRNDGIEDLVQAGVLALIEAIPRFDLSKENAFLTFVGWHVLKGIQRCAYKIGTKMLDRKGRKNPDGTAEDDSYFVTVSTDSMDAPLEEVIPGRIMGPEEEIIYEEFDSKILSHKECVRNEANTLELIETLPEYFRKKVLSGSPTAIFRAKQLGKRIKKGQDVSEIIKDIRMIYEIPTLFDDPDPFRPAPIAA